MVTVHNFSYGALNPALGYVMSCVGSFLGLRCVILARASTSSAGRPNVMKACTSNAPSVAASMAAMIISSIEKPRR